MTDTAEEEASCRIVINLEDHYPIKNEEIAEWRTKLDDAARSLALEGPGNPGQGRGIVICGGGYRCFTGAWILISFLRKIGCRLPIQLWHMGEGEFDRKMGSLAKTLGVECVDATRYSFPSSLKGRAGGWALKPFAILNCP
jgi:hypothetical protein